MLWQPTRGIIQPNQHWRRSQDAGGAWSPLDLGAALIAWYKADAGVYSDAGTTPATDGQTVQQWNDQSGNGLHLKQATSGNRPTFQSSGFNTSYPCVYFGPSTVDDYMTTDTDAVTQLSATTASYFIVAKPTTGLGANARVGGYIKSGQSQDYNNAGSAVLMFRNSSNAEIGSYANSALRGTIGISLDANYRLGSIFDGANVHHYVNNDATGESAGTYSTAFSSPGRLSVGADGSPGSFFKGPISEIVLTNTAFSSGDRTSLDDYFKGLWGL